MWTRYNCPPLFVTIFAVICVAAHTVEKKESFNLVLGVDHNVHLEELRIFLASLRSSGCRADVILFCGSAVPQVKRVLAERYSATLLEYSFADLNRTHGPVGVHRFHLYRKYLETTHREYSFVLHTDVRDVVFQDDPFSRIDAHGGAAFFLESDHLLIGTSPTNTGWMTDNCTVYKQERMLERTHKRLRSCSGNMYGTKTAVLIYAQMMEEEQQRTATVIQDQSGTIVEGGWCADQAVHQALLWTGEFAKRMNVTVYRNEDGPVCTMGDMPQIFIDDQGDVRTPEGSLYAIVHQYDRHQRVRDTLRARYDEEDQPQHVNPSYIPGYAPKILYGDPTKIQRHQDADISIPEQEGKDRLMDKVLEEGGEDQHVLASTLGTAGTTNELQQDHEFSKRSSTDEFATADCVASGQCVLSGHDGKSDLPENNATYKPPPSLVQLAEAEIARREAPYIAGIQAVLSNLPPYIAGMYQGRGIVMSAGGQLQVANAYVVLRALRETGCMLPVELFYAGSDEMSAEVVQVLEALGAIALDVTHFQGTHGLYLRGFQIKAFAVLHSSFEEVLWLDSDCLPASDPSTLFDSPQYLDAGCLFWNDFTVDPHWLDPAFLRAYGIEMVHGEHELEAGQFMLNKPRCWAALHATVYMNSQYMHFYRHMYGDKDTWRLSFKIVRQTMGLVPHLADMLARTDPSGRLCGNTMVHKAPDGSPMFLHRTLQSLPGVATPLPWTHVTDDVVRAAAAMPSMWLNVTQGGMQRLKSRQNTWSQGWTVDKQEVDMTGHMHWCLYVDDDTTVRLVEAPSYIKNIEAQIRQYLLDLAALGIMETIDPGSES